MKRIRLIIAGRVQGVAFRYHTVQAAERFGVYGWVKNLPDGTVEAVAEGAEKDVNRFASWCHEGPASARVTGVKLNEEPAAGGFDGFEIRY